LALDGEADLAELARDAALLSGHAEEDLRVQLPPSLVLQHTHPLLLERMIMNLIGNVFVHGQVPLELRIEERGAHVIIEVSDAGVGLPPDQRERLLQAFARGDAARSKAGAGLGLGIVSRVVTRMGGTLKFDRRDDRHVVRVEIPRLD
jgi:signal transduction histidine kinase